MAAVAAAALRSARPSTAMGSARADDSGAMRSSSMHSLASFRAVSARKKEQLLRDKAVAAAEAGTISEAEKKKKKRWAIDSRAIGGVDVQRKHTTFTPAPHFHEI